MSKRDTLISLHGVTCDLGGVRILDGIDLELKRGEITVVLGPSGAGKSTLLRVIAGFEPLSGGEIKSPDGVLSSATNNVPPERRKVGFVVQNFALFPHLTARDNVRFGLDRSAPPSIANDWLERVKLKARADAYPHELSGGEQQRVALARALARQPDIVLLDEAFSSLDQQLRKSVRREAKSLLREAGAAVLAVTHDPDEALELADRIVIFSDGHVLQSGDPEELYWHPQSVIAARLLGEVNELAGQVDKSLFATDFGVIELPQNDQPSPQIALVRPNAVAAKSDTNGPAEVTEIEFSLGQKYLTLQSRNGAILRVSSVSDTDLSVGDRVSLEFDSTRIGWVRDANPQP